MILLQCGRWMKDIASYKSPSHSTLENQQLADNFNDFYCRFGKTPHTRPEHLSTQPLTPPATTLFPTPALKISVDDVCQVFKENKRRKAPGPDSVSPACLKTCADQLAPSSQRSLTDHWSCAKSPHASNAPPSSPSQRNQKLLDIWCFSTAWYGTVRHGSVRYGTAQFRSVCISTAV